MPDMTVTEMARAYGVSRTTIHRWIGQTRPRLRPRIVAGDVWLLSEADQRAVLERPRKRMGRPKKVVDTVELEKVESTS